LPTQKNIQFFVPEMDLILYVLDNSATLMYMYTDVILVNGFYSRERSLEFMLQTKNES